MWETMIYEEEEVPDDKFLSSSHGNAPMYGGISSIQDRGGNG